MLECVASRPNLMSKLAWGLDLSETIVGIRQVVAPGDLGMIVSNIGITPDPRTSRLHGCVRMPGQGRRANRTDVAAGRRTGQVILTVNPYPLVSNRRLDHGSRVMAGMSREFRCHRIGYP